MVNFIYNYTRVCKKNLKKHFIKFFVKFTFKYIIEGMAQHSPPLSNSLLCFLGLVWCDPTYHLPPHLYVCCRSRMLIHPSCLFYDHSMGLHFDEVCYQPCQLVPSLASLLFPTINLLAHIMAHTMLCID